MIATTSITQFKKPIRSALQKIGRNVGWEYYNDVPNNGTTHRRIKFALEDETPLTTQELETFVGTLQQSFPRYQVDGKNFVDYAGRNYVVTYLRWRD